MNYDLHTQVMEYMTSVLMFKKSGLAANICDRRNGSGQELSPEQGRLTPSLHCAASLAGTVSASLIKDIFPQSEMQKQLRMKAHSNLQPQHAAIWPNT